MTTNLTRRAEMLDIYSELHEQSSEAISDQERTELEGGANRLRGQTFTIAFIGRFSVGKSLLINRLFLGEDVLTFNLKPTTARTLLIRYGESPALSLVYPDMDGAEHRDVLVPPGGELKAIAAAIMEHTTHLGSPAGHESGYFQLDWPNGQFFREGVQLLDTIGTEDIDDRFIDQTYKAIKSSDAVVMTLSMTQPLTDSERRFLEQHLARTGKKVFLVVNKADARSPEEQEMVLKDLNQRFGALYRESEIRVAERIFAVSAKTGEGLETLRERLVHFVTEERLREILQSHGEWLRGRLHIWSMDCRQTLTGYEAKKAGDDDQLRIAGDKLRALAERLHHERERLNDLRIDLAEELSRLISDLRDRCVRELKSLDQQGASVQVIGTDLAMAFADGIAGVTTHVQHSARKALQYRIGKLASIDDPSIKQIDASNTGIPDELISNAGKAAGLGAIAVGGGNVLIALQVAMATPVPWFGLGGTSLTTLFAGALAPWAIPVILVGAAIFWGSGEYRETRKRQKREAWIASARHSLEKDFVAVESHLAEQLDQYIDAVWQQAEQRVAQERKSLEFLIAETDLTTLDTRISTMRSEEQRLNDITRRLDTLLPKVA